MILRRRDQYEKCVGINYLVLQNFHCVNNKFQSLFSQYKWQLLYTTAHLIARGVDDAISTSCVEAIKILLNISI